MFEVIEERPVRVGPNIVQVTCDGCKVRLYEGPFDTKIPVPIFTIHVENLGRLKTIQLGLDKWGVRGSVDLCEKCLSRVLDLSKVG